MIWTNPGQAQTQINNFLDYGKNVSDVLIKALENFTISLSTSWYSPKAVDFYNKNIQKTFAAICNLESAYNNIGAAAARAFNAHARANDIATINVPSTEIYTTDGVEAFWYGLEEKSPMGIVGMDKSTVELAKSEFHKKVDNAMQLIDETPYDIAFYDEDGMQVATFKSEINKMKNQFTNQLEMLDRELESALHDEIQTVELAAKQAVSELQSTTQL